MHNRVHVLYITDGAFMSCIRKEPERKKEELLLSRSYFSSVWHAYIFSASTLDLILQGTFLILSKQSPCDRFVFNFQTQLLLLSFGEMA